MKKVLILALMVLVLTGCTDSSTKKESTSAIFKNEILAVSKIADAKNKELSNEILIEEIDEIFNGIFDLAIFESNSVEYGEITQGAGSDGKGGKVFCCKLPADVKFTGTKDSVKRFVEYFEEIDRVISFGDFKINELEDNKYEVTTTISFLGKATGGTVSKGKTGFSVKRNEVEVEQEEEIVLRNFDISMIIRPSNSDSSAIALGVMGDKDYRIYSAENKKKDIDVVFGNDGNKVFCEYSIDGEEKEKAYITPKGNILFDILSCDIIESDDEIKADVHIFNNTSKKVSVAIFDDKDSRVKIVEKVGSVEVKK